MKLEAVSFLVHHSHTDIGYTQDQPAGWKAQRLFRGTAVDALEPDGGHDGDDAFGWTVETG